MRILRDFQLRPELERTWLTEETWCDKCQEPDLGMIETFEYEELGHIFVEGRCSKCGSSVVTKITEIIEKDCP